jgi:hypothetical protein
MNPALKDHMLTGDESTSNRPHNAVVAMSELIGALQGRNNTGTPAQGREKSKLNPEILLDNSGRKVIL